MAFLSRKGQTCSPGLPGAIHIALRSSCLPGFGTDKTGMNCHCAWLPSGLGSDTSLHTGWFCEQLLPCILLIASKAAASLHSSGFTLPAEMFRTVPPPFY